MHYLRVLILYTTSLLGLRDAQSSNQAIQCTCTEKVYDLHYEFNINMAKKHSKLSKHDIKNFHEQF